MPELDAYVLAFLRGVHTQRYLDGFTCAELTADINQARRAAGKPAMTGVQVSGALRRLRADGHVAYEPRARVFIGTTAYRPDGWAWQPAAWFLVEHVSKSPR